MDTLSIHILRESYLNVLWSIRIPDDPHLRR